MGVKPKWTYWLSLYELDVLSLIWLSIGLNPTGRNSKYLSLDEVYGFVSYDEFELRQDILLSYIGNENHHLFKFNSEVLSKIHAKIRIKDFIEWADQKGWDLPFELKNMLNPKEIQNINNEKGKFRPKGISLAKESAINKAKELAKIEWEKDKDHSIKLGSMVQIIWEQLIDLEYTDQLPNESRSIRHWIKDIAPSYARKGGRPKRNL